MGYLMIVFLTVLVTVVGGGGFYLLRLMFKPKIMAWNAEVFQLAEGIQPPDKDKDGNYISDLRLSDLRPYTKDVLQRIERDKGIVVYLLKKLRKATPPVNSNVVEYWGAKDKRVKVLLDGETCTLLRSGYDRKTSKYVFKPLPADRVNLIKGEINDRNERIKEKKTLAQQIIPAVITGMIIVGAMLSIYLVADGYVKVSDNLVRASEINAEAMKDSATMLVEAGCGSVEKLYPDIAKEIPPEVNG